MESRRIERVEREALLLLKRARQRVWGARPQVTVFVAGVQRSGTNMMMDVLERSPDTAVYHESDSRAFDNYQMRPREIIHGLRNKARGSHFIIKSLCELQHLSDLMSDFAPSRTLWMVRDYRDVVNSMRKSFRNQAKQVRRIAMDRDSDGWLGEGMSDETHVLLNALVDDQVDDNSAAALIWYFRNVLYFEQNLDRDERVLLIPYERLVQQPVELFAQAFAFLDLPFRPAFSKRVHARSVSKSAQPLIRQPIRQVCDKLMARFTELYAS